MALTTHTLHAATLCPSFWRARVVSNPTWRERALARVRAFLAGIPLP